jgi:hypothetical protein
MSEFHDESATVSIERSVLLWCMRAFVHGRRRDIDAGKHIGAAMRRVGAADAAPAFQAFMQGVGSFALRPVGVHCLCCRGISTDEHALLDVLALAQQHRPIEALMLLRGLVGPDGARLALERAALTGSALARAGWFLDEPDATLRHFAMAMPTPTHRPHGPGCDARL